MLIISAARSDGGRFFGAYSAFVTAGAMIGGLAPAPSMSARVAARVAMVRGRRMGFMAPLVLMVFMGRGELLMAAMAFAGAFVAVMGAAFVAAMVGGCGVLFFAGMSAMRACVAIARRRAFMAVMFRSEAAGEARSERIVEIVRRIVAHVRGQQLAVMLEVFDICKLLGRIAIGGERGQIVHDFQPGERVDQFLVEFVGRGGDALAAHGGDKAKDGGVSRTALGAAAR